MEKSVVAIQPIPLPTDRFLFTSTDILLDNRYKPNKFKKLFLKKGRTVKDEINKPAFRKSQPCCLQVSKVVVFKTNT